MTPAVVNVSVNPDSLEGRTRLTVKNPTSQAKKFTWQLTVQSATNTWQYFLCDVKNCSPTGVTGAGYKIDVAPNSTTFLDVVVRPNKQLGAAVFDLKILDGATESPVASSRILFSTSTTLKEYTRVTGNGIRIYPNPAQDFFMLADDNDAVDRVVVYNIIGRQVKNQKAMENFKYTVNDLPDGFYIVRLLSANGTTLRTIRLNKAKPKA